MFVIDAPHPHPTNEGIEAELAVAARLPI